jgi:crotonobetainyl-CoA:carnitine CoA-transferase CaiB-like acyl-CoA transferase
LRELEAVLIPIFASDTTEAWLARLDAARVPTSPVLTLEEILTHDHLAARSTAVAPPGGHAAVQKVVPAPIRMAQSPVRVRRAAPAHGEHTAEILAALAAGSAWPEAAHAGA